MKWKPHVALDGCLLKQSREVPIRRGTAQQGWVDAIRAWDEWGIQLDFHNRWIAEKTGGLEIREGLDSWFGLGAGEGITQ
jgi:hypothetical protein